MQYSFSQKGFSTGLVLIGAGLLFAILIVTYIHIGQPKQYAPSTSSSLSSSAVPNTSSVNSWNIYKSKNYGFEIQYPDSWVVEENQSTNGFIMLLPKEFQNDKRDMGIVIAPAGAGRESVFDKGAKPNCIVKKLYIANNVAQYCESTLNNGRSIDARLTTLPNDMWHRENEISYFLRNENLDMLPIYKDVVATIQFPEHVTPNAGWKGYLDHKYGFQLLYPEVLDLVFDARGYENSLGSYVIKFSDANGNEKVSSAIAVKEGWSMEQELAMVKATYPLDNKIDSFLINGQPAKRITFSEPIGLTGEEVVVMRGSNVIIFSYDSSADLFRAVVQTYK